MKTGDEVKVRRLGGEWGRGTVVMASSNLRSLLLSGEVLPNPEKGLTVHPSLGKVLALLREDDASDYYELMTGEVFEVSKT